MEIDPSALSAREAYDLMIRCVIPRPIAWVSTRSPEGAPNLAPFSFFGGVSTDPMTVMLSVGRRRGQRKDTARNLLATEEAVVHIPTRALEQAMALTAADAAPDVDEFTLAGLARLPSVRVAPERIAEAPVALEAVLRTHLEVGRGPVDMFLLEIVHLHLADEILSDGLPDAARLQALGRLGGRQYADTSRPHELARPDERP